MIMTKKMYNRIGERKGRIKRSDLGKRLLCREEKMRKKIYINKINNTFFPDIT